MKIFLLTSLVLLVLLFLTILPALPPRIPRNFQDITDMETYLDKLVLSNNPPSISVAVVKEGTQVYNYSTGFADPQKTIPASNDTVYHWWSMTKIPTAILIMQFAEAGILQLDDPVVQYLDFFTVEYQGQPVDNITIRSKGKRMPNPVNLQFTDVPVQGANICGNTVMWHVDQETLPAVGTSGPNPKSSYQASAREGSMLAPFASITAPT